MKAISFLPLFFCLLATSLFSQSNINQTLSVNSSGAAPDASAQLDVQATDKGMLVPRMTTAQRTAITAANALLVFDSDTRSFWFFDTPGAAWREIRAGSVATLQDADGNTKVQVEETANEDIIRMDLAGSERWVLKRNASGKTQLSLPNNSHDIFLGDNAGNSNSTGFSNIAVGKDALFLNTTRSNLVAVGDSALHNNGSNVVFSYEAIRNTALGSKTLYSNTAGFENTASGWEALFANTFGDQNTANGKAALHNNTTGDANTAIGWEALSSNTTGGGNTASGSAALQSNTSGTSNTAVGSSALVNNTTGAQHTAVGAAALSTSSTGSRNTALGAQANIGFGNLSNATAIGAKAFVNASNCLVLGSIAGVNSATESVNVGIGTTTPDVRLQVVDGSDASPTNNGGYIQAGSMTSTNIVIDDNEIMARNNGAAATLFLNNGGGNAKIGNSASLLGIGRSAATNNLEVEGSASKSSAGSWLANSDARLKKNITPLDSREILEKLLALQGVTYEWNDDKTGSKRPEGIQYGFTAQNIREVFPTLVEEDKVGYLQTAYGTYDAMLVEAIRALNEEIEQLKMENGTLRKDNGDMKSQLASQAASLENLSRELGKITAALLNAGISVEK